MRFWKVAWTLVEEGPRGDLYNRLHNTKVEAEGYARELRRDAAVNPDSVAVSALTVPYRGRRMMIWWALTYELEGEPDGWDAHEATLARLAADAAKDDAQLVADARLNSIPKSL